MKYGRIYSCSHVTIFLHANWQITRYLSELFPDHINAAVITLDVSNYQYYLGSQWAIRKSKLIRVTNMSDSRRISWTLGGGSAMAMATIPSRGGDDLRVCEKVYCGRSLDRTSTTWKMECTGLQLMSFDNLLKREHKAINSINNSIAHMPHQWTQ